MDNAAPWLLSKAVRMTLAIFILLLLLGNAAWFGFGYQIGKRHKHEAQAARFGPATPDWEEPAV